MKDLTLWVVLGVPLGVLLGMPLGAHIRQSVLENDWCEAQQAKTVDSLCIRDSLVVQYPDWLRPRP